MPRGTTMKQSMADGLFHQKYEKKLSNTIKSVKLPTGTLEWHLRIGSMKISIWEERKNIGLKWKLQDVPSLFIWRRSIFMKDHLTLSK